MLLTSRKCLVFFLVLLQFIAPLVHAHTREQFSAAAAGLHVPGLETYSLAWATHDASPAVSLSQHSGPDSSVEGVLIAVDTGMRDQEAIHPVLKNQDIDGHSLYLLLHTYVFSTLTRSQNSFPVRQLTLPKQFLFDHASRPRAPPAQASF